MKRDQARKSILTVLFIVICVIYWLYGSSGGS